MPDALVQPFTVVTTLYVPAAVTLIAVVVSPVLHANAPAAGVDNFELPQLLTTVITGVAGFVFRAAVPDPEGLVQPFDDCVTE